MITRRTLLLASLTLSVLTGRAQRDDSTGFEIRPTFGLGAGMFAFYGDIGNNHEGYSPLVSRLGFELRAGTPITEWLDVSLFALHGRVGANERSTTRNLNFMSRITTGGFQFTYNFAQLLPAKRSIEPYFGLGLESVEFLSKTDLFDAQGRRYFYWADGTIRDIDEHAANAGDAVLLQRDHTYESDIRELDLDGFGKYNERSWAVPLSIGARMRIGGGWDLNVGTTLHLTFTDLVDGVTADSREDRVGDGKNDRFLYTSFTLSKAISIGPRKHKAGEPDLTPAEMDLLVLNDDEDGDGVKDFDDLCPGTPAGVVVSKRGCPMDSDGDGVPDHLDDEPATPPGLAVDVHGVTLADDAFLKDYLNYKDSGNVTIVTSRVESLDRGPRNQVVQRKRVYTVQVGSEVTGITEDQMRTLLSIPDLRTVEHGDTISFVVGGYTDLPEAIRRQIALKGEGIEGTVVADDNGQLIDIGKEVEAARATLTDNPSAGPATKNTVVRVQLGAFKQKLGRDIFSGINDLVVLKGEDGLTRYYTGAFSDVNPAAAHKVDMLKKGFSGAFLVAFKDGKRVSLKEAGAKLTGPEDLNGLPSGGVDKGLVHYRVQLGTFAGNVPTDVMSKYIEIGNVEPVTSADAVRYYYGNFPSRTDAEDARKALQEKGLADAFVVGAFGTRIIAAEEADKLLAEP